MRYIIVSALGHSQGPTYTILVSGQHNFGSDDLGTTRVFPCTSTHLPSRVHQSVVGWSLLDAHVVYVELLDGMAMEATI